MKESKQLEYKESVTNTFLKTVSAFANYGTGKIMFGVRDDGSTAGIDAPEQACLDIENRINDSIDPIPEYTLAVQGSPSVIVLTVFEGTRKPYLYRAKAYRRSDTATIAADRLELTRLILEGQNLSYEELPAKNQTLTFTVLEEKLRQALNLKAVTIETLKTLELYQDGSGFNVAGELLSDQNHFPGIDLMRFGETISIIYHRETMDRESVLQQYDRAMTLYRTYYQYEEIKGSTRETISLVPEEAYREAIANALVHRSWDVEAPINVAMYPDRIEVTSPGGLPGGMRREEYLAGGISILRNRILAGIFYRLHLIEHFGTGIRRINELYKDSAVKPQFGVAEESIRITLPVMEHLEHLTAEEQMVYRLIKNRAVTTTAVAEATGFGKTKALSMLKKLVEKGYVQNTGRGRGSKYTAK